MVVSTERIVERLALFERPCGSNDPMVHRMAVEVYNGRCFKRSQLRYSTENAIAASSS